MVLTSSNCSGTISCEEPLWLAWGGIGLVIVHPDGKVSEHHVSRFHALANDIIQPAQTDFELLRYDEETDTSLVICMLLSLLNDFGCITDGRQVDPKPAAVRCCSLSQSLDLCVFSSPDSSPSPVYGFSHRERSAVW
jgi:hypothetical protein